MRAVFQCVKGCHMAEAIDLFSEWRILYRSWREPDLAQHKEKLLNLEPALCLPEDPDAWGSHAWHGFQTKKKQRQWHQKILTWTSLVAQWLGVCLPMQGTWVRSLVQEDPTCRGATEPVHHNYWACALEPVLHNKRSHCNEKLAHRNEE